ncbi:MAG: GDP-mannose 4,6-dehydratase, partial [Verrucomicrobiota bacterium]|nr:GDP-mannose 4,6-dehydratase [Verrucomicrobiota bacterium]
MKTILVTGGLGFIGSNFIRMLLQEDVFEKVINLDKQTYAGNPENLSGFQNHPRYVFQRGDICDQTSLESILMENEVDAVVNFAAESHVDRSIDGPEPFVQTNIVGTLRLLEATKTFLSKCTADLQKAFRFLHVSTDEVYGSLTAEDPAFCESTRYAPNSPYSASKAAADHLARAYHHTFGLPVLTTNCSNNYGPYQFPEKLIPLMILNACEGKSLPIYGDGSNV